MKTRKFITAAITAALYAMTPPAPAQAQDWVDMLAGGLGQWNVLGDANWSQKDGVTQADSGKGFIVTKGTYSNYELKLEFYSGTNTNSGVFMRCANAGKIDDKTCYEANIYDLRNDQSGRTGGIPNFAPPKVVLATENQWNTYEITAKGAHITIKLNGQLTVDFKDTTLSSGPIALQYSRGVIKFRNMKIKKL